MAEQPPLLIVSNRGPLRFSRGPDGEIVASRGGGGLVTALSGLAAVRPVTWIASALTDEDAEVAERGPTATAISPCAWSCTTARSSTATTTSSRTRRCGSSTTTCGASRTEPSVDRNVRLAWDAGLRPGQPRFADAVVAELEAAERPTAAGDAAGLPAVRGAGDRSASAAPDAVMQHFTHIPWPMPDYWRVLPPDIRTTIHDVAARVRRRSACTRPATSANFLNCVAQFTDADVDFKARTVHHDGRVVRVREHPISVDPAEFDRLRRRRARSWRSARRCRSGGPRRWCCASTAPTRPRTSSAGSRRSSSSWPTTPSGRGG